MRMLVLLVLSCGLIGCGSATNRAAPAAQRSGTPQTSGSLDRTLFTIADFEPGWAGVPANTIGADADCTSHATTVGAESALDVSMAVFAKGLLGPYVAQHVERAQVGQGKFALASRMTAFAGCKAYTSTDSAGRVTKYETLPLAVPGIGDGAAGYRVTSAGGGAADVIVFRRGDLVESLTYAGILIDNNDAILWAQKAATKLR